MAVGSELNQLTLQTVEESVVLLKRQELSKLLHFLLKVFVIPSQSPFRARMSLLERRRVHVDQAVVARDFLAKVSFAQSQPMVSRYIRSLHNPTRLQQGYVARSDDRGTRTCTC